MIASLATAIVASGMLLLLGWSLSDSFEEATSPAPEGKVLKVDPLIRFMLLLMSPPVLTVAVCVYGWKGLKGASKEFYVAILKGRRMWLSEVVGHE